MNPLTNVRNLSKLNERELEMGIAGDSSRSWHQKYRDSAWIFVGGLPYDLTEGDVICVFSQWGEVVNLNMVRDRKTGKTRGFCFLCYEDQRSTVLAVDNFNGIKLLGRVIRVDHVEEYRVPKIKGDEDEDVTKIWQDGCAPKPVPLHPSPDPSSPERKINAKKEEEEDGLMDPASFLKAGEDAKKKKKAKKEKKKKKDKKKEKKRKRARDSNSDSSSESEAEKFKRQRRDNDKPGPSRGGDFGGEESRRSDGNRGERFERPRERDAGRQFDRGAPSREERGGDRNWSRNTGYGRESEGVEREGGRRAAVGLQCQKGW